MWIFRRKLRANGAATFVGCNRKIIFFYLLSWFFAADPEWMENVHPAMIISKEASAEIAEKKHGSTLAWLSGGSLWYSRVLEISWKTWRSKHTNLQAGTLEEDFLSEMTFYALNEIISSENNFTVLREGRKKYEDIFDICYSALRHSR